MRCEITTATINVEKREPTIRALVQQLNSIQIDPSAIRDQELTPNAIHRIKQKI